MSSDAYITIGLICIILLLISGYTWFYVSPTGCLVTRRECLTSRENGKSSKHVTWANNLVDIKIIPNRQSPDYVKL